MFSQARIYDKWWLVWKTTSTFLRIWAMLPSEMLWIFFYPWISIKWWKPVWIHAWWWSSGGNFRPWTASTRWFTYCEHLALKVWFHFMTRHQSFEICQAVMLTFSPKVHVRYTWYCFIKLSKCFHKCAQRKHNPLLPKGRPFDEKNRLALDRVKSVSHSWIVKG